MRRPRFPVFARALVLPLAVLPLAVVAIAVGALAVAPTAALAQDGRPERAVTYRAPVAAPVIDPFRPPATRFGPGNRGLEYGTTPGTPVVAAAEGRVTFAGQVGGDLHVTVQHADGLRTTYAFLAAIGVRAGTQVEAGAVVGRAGSRLLWTARLGDAYLDPAVLLAASGAGELRLVPDARTSGDRRDPGLRPRPAAHRPPAADRSPVGAAAAGWALGAGP